MAAGAGSMLAFVAVVYFEGVGCISANLSFIRPMRKFVTDRVRCSLATWSLISFANTWYMPVLVAVMDHVRYRAKLFMFSIADCSSVGVQLAET